MYTFLLAQRTYVSGKKLEMSKINKKGGMMRGG